MNFLESPIRRGFSAVIFWPHEECSLLQMARAPFKNKQKRPFERKFPVSQWTSKNLEWAIEII